MKLLWLLLINWLLILNGMAYANTKENIKVQEDYTCLQVKACNINYATAKNVEIANINSKAIKCFQKNGDIEMADLASYEYTLCNTINASTNFTIKN